MKYSELTPLYLLAITKDRWQLRYFYFFTREAVPLSIWRWWLPTGKFWPFKWSGIPRRPKSTLPSWRRPTFWRNMLTASPSSKSWNTISVRDQIESKLCRFDIRLVVFLTWETGQLLKEPASTSCLTSFLGTNIISYFVRTFYLLGR